MGVSARFFFNMLKDSSVKGKSAGRVRRHCLYIRDCLDRIGTEWYARAIPVTYIVGCGVRACVQSSRSEPFEGTQMRLAVALIRAFIF